MPIFLLSLFLLTNVSFAEDAPKPISNILSLPRKWAKLEIGIRTKADLEVPSISGDRLRFLRMDDSELIVFESVYQQPMLGPGTLKLITKKEMDSILKEFAALQVEEEKAWRKLPILEKIEIAESIAESNDKAPTPTLFFRVLCEGPLPTLTHGPCLGFHFDEFSGKGEALLKKKMTRKN